MSSNLDNSSHSCVYTGQQKFSTGKVEPFFSTLNHYDYTINHYYTSIRLLLATSGFTTLSGPLGELR